MRPTDVMSNSGKAKDFLKSEDSSNSMAATEALDYLLQTEESNSLMFDLTELLKRDPDLTSLTSLKTESDNLISGSGVTGNEGDKGSFINHTNNFDSDHGDFLTNQNKQSPLTAADPNLVIGSGPKHFSAPTSEYDDSHAISSSYGAFGTGSSAASSLVSSSPLTTNATSHAMDTSNATTLSAVNGIQNENVMKLEDLDVDFHDYFTSEEAKNVSFGVPYKSSVAVKSESGQHKNLSGTGGGLTISSSGNLWQNDPETLFFGTSSLATQSGGIVTSTNSKDLLSSSVPTVGNLLLQNSPLSDILTELTPSAPATTLSGRQSSGIGPERHSTLHKLLLRKDPVARPSPVRSPENRKTLEKLRTSLSASNPRLSPQQLSSSAPTQQQSYLEKVRWTRREPRQHISSVCSVGGESSIADEVNDALNGLSPNELPDIESDDEHTENNDKDSSQEDFSDDDASGSQAGESYNPRPRTSSTSSTSKKERYFWQYNVQAKGPKGQKIVVETKIEDPHVLNEIVDPVFSGDVQLQGIKHSGKARRGDGNDLTANPKKLAAIGKELDHLSKVINDLTPVSEMPFNSRCKSRKEKNKLASRACRLKKKAQHEANKLKCHGLEEEHHALTMAIRRAKDIMLAKVEGTSSASQELLTKELDATVNELMSNKVAGNTTEYVNIQIGKYMNNV